MPLRPRIRKALRPIIEQLEQRLLLSADLESVLVDPNLAHDERAEDPAAQLDLLQAEAEAGEVAAIIRQELVFVDMGVEGYERLVDDLLAGAAEGRNLEVVLLDAERDGVAQITETLARYQELDAIHIVSHGDAGSVQLGNISLSSDSLDLHADALASWGNALGAQADLLFYGCDLAGGAGGEAFVDSLAELTGADVTASVDLTGSTLRGGDWDLEYATGSIDVGVAFSAQLQQEWSGLLTQSILTNYETVDSDFEIKTDQNPGQTFSYTSGGGTYSQTDNRRGPHCLPRPRTDD